MTSGNTIQTTALIERLNNSRLGTSLVLHINHAAELTEAHIISLIDAWPPATLQMANGLAMASTMTWTIDFIQPRKMMKSTDWLAYRCETLHSSSGYGTTDANIWSQAGDLVAVSRQCVTVFA